MNHQCLSNNLKIIYHQRILNMLFLIMLWSHVVPHSNKILNERNSKIYESTTKTDFIQQELGKLNVVPIHSAPLAIGRSHRRSWQLCFLKVIHHSSVFRKLSLWHPYERVLVFVKGNLPCVESWLHCSLLLTWYWLRDNWNSRVVPLPQCEKRTY